MNTIAFLKHIQSISEAAPEFAKHLQTKVSRGTGKITPLGGYQSPKGPKTIRYFLDRKAPPTIYFDKGRKPVADAGAFLLTDAEIDGWWDIISQGHVGLAGTEGFQIYLTFTLQIMGAITRQYNNPKTPRCSVIINHEKAGMYHGWVKELRIKEDRLQARLMDLAPWLRDALKRGQINARSIEADISEDKEGKSPRLFALSFLDGLEPGDNTLSARPDKE